MTIMETIRLDDGYVIKIHLDEDPLKPDADGQGVLITAELDSYGSYNTDILHCDGGKGPHVLKREAVVNKPRTEEQWASLEQAYRTLEEWWREAVVLDGALHAALNRAAERGLREREFAERYLRAFFGVVSITDVRWSDGRLFNIVTSAMVERWGVPADRVATVAEEGLREWEAYRDGDVYGYVVTHEDGHTIEDASGWGFYGDESYDERTERETVAQYLLPGTRVLFPNGTVEVIESIRDEIGWLTEPNWGGRSPSVLRGLITVFWKGRSLLLFEETDPVVIVEPGYMRQQFMEVVEHDRRQRAEDEQEIAELRAAELGAVAV